MSKFKEYMNVIQENRISINEAAPNIEEILRIQKEEIRNWANDFMEGFINGIFEVYNELKKNEQKKVFYRNVLRIIKDIEQLISKGYGKQRAFSIEDKDDKKILDSLESKMKEMEIYNVQSTIKGNVLEQLTFNNMLKVFDYVSSKIKNQFLRKINKFKNKLIN
jgi:hypothetical protein